tara:strand:+ start:80 stop:1330 length:1251 start_codon:yes stop_codon:yes gene_type:complete
MKKLSSFLLTIAILSFILVHSCSSEEDDTTAPNVIQTSEPEPPAPTQYSLTVTAGEGGTVSTEGGTYDEGTEVTITATPSEGYRFIGWEGCDGGIFCDDLPNNIITYYDTFTFDITSNTKIKAIYILAESSTPDLISNSGYKFYYNFSNGMPLEWITYFKNLMIYLNELFDIKPRGPEYGAIGNGDQGIVYSWVLEEGSPFEDEIGLPYCKTCVYGYKTNKSLLLGLENEEVENIGVGSNFHGYSVIVHEIFHVYQLNKSNLEEPPFSDLIPYVKYIFEGGAAALESLWIQQTFGYNYFYDQNQHDAQQAIESPELFEDPHNDLAIDDNYSNSIFLFLALVKEIQSKNNIDEISAFKKVYVDWWSYEGERLTKEEQFELIFGFSIQSFYDSLDNYSPEIQSVLPSETITLEEIFQG